MPTATFNFPDLHQGSPYLYVLPGGPPAAGARLLVDINGNPIGAGQPFFMGSSQAPCTLHFSAKIEMIEIDQETAPVDAIMTAEAATIEITLKESDLLKVNFALAHSTYSAGTDTGLPTGNQNYQMLTVGGLVCIPKYTIALVSPRRCTNNEKNFVACIYSAVASDPYQIDITRTKETMYKVKWTGLSVPSRPQGDKVAQYYRQV
jgi:hypothetical protein